jgi:hypothetical protein
MWSRTAKSCGPGLPTLEASSQSLRTRPTTGKKKALPEDGTKDIWICRARRGRLGCDGTVGWIRTTDLLIHSQAL